MIYKTYLVAVVGGLVLLTGLYGWAMEPSAEPADHHGPEGEAEGEPATEDAALVAAGDAPAELEAAPTTETTEG
jgi:hypothetical protein